MRPSHILSEVLVTEAPLAASELVSYRFAQGCLLFFPTVYLAQQFGTVMNDLNKQAGTEENKTGLAIENYL